MRVPVLLACVACAGGACGGDGARLQLQAINAGPCGRPDDAVTMLVTMLGDFSPKRKAIDADGAIELIDLPSGTRNLSVEILGAGGATRAIGRTATFALDALGDGDVIPIAMAPPDGLCPAGVLVAGRDGARIARVADGVLVVGGAPSAELYDPATERAAQVVLPVGFDGAGGLVGAALAPLPGGGAALIGGPSHGLAIYEPGHGFGGGRITAEIRGHHVALALDDHHVLVAAGCGIVGEDGSCELGNARLDAGVVDLDTGGLVGPRLPLTLARLDGHGTIEIDADGRRSALLTGGVDPTGAPVTSAERVFLDGSASIVIADAGAAIARLDSGGSLTAFGPAGASRAAAAVVVPAGATARLTPAIAARGGAVLVTQDDGLVLGLGDGPPIRYRPSQHDWEQLPDPGVALAGAPAALRWDDGTVLVFGGLDGGAPSANVWRFRPRLLGPFAPVAFLPRQAVDDPPLTPLDPAAIDHAGGWRIGGPAPSWAIIGGPTGGPLTVDLALDVPAGGVTILTSFVDPANHDRVTLVPGQRATLAEVRGGVAAERCLGAAVPAAGFTSIHLDLGTSTLRVTDAGLGVLQCSQDDRVRGAVGVGSLGDPVAIESISIGR